MHVPAPLRRPLPVALLLMAAAQALFTWRLTIPHRLVFDEVHYVPAARTLLALAGHTNIEHPLLGKTLIGLGILLFGDGPAGWRALSTLAGTATVGGVFWILWLTTRRLRPAILGTLLALFNFTLLVQARIAMLDGFMAAFVVLAVAAMLWAMRGPHATARWTLGAVLLGLAAGTKWTAIPYVGYAALAIAILRHRDPARWPGLSVVRAWLILGLVGGVTYLATFAPAFFYSDNPLSIAALLPFQLDIYHQQTQVLSAHTYQSDWWSWPLMLRPIWYFYDVADGAQRGILMVGNPVVMWGGLVAVAACLWGAVRRRDVRLGAVAALWLGSYLIWAVIPKSLGFFYYYYLPSLWLPIVIAVAADHWRGALRDGDDMLLIGAAALFLWFYPILSAAPLAHADSFRRWTLLPDWN